MSQLAAPARPVRTPRPGPRSARPASRASRPTSRPAVTARRSAPVRSGAGVATVARARRGNGFMISVVLVALTSIMALLLLNTMRAEQSFTLSKLRADVATLGDQEQALDSELSAVSASERLAVRADELGMRPAASIKYVDRATGKSLGVAGSASAGQALSVNTLPDTPARRAATDVLASGGVGVHITDPVARAAAAAKAKAEAQQKKAGAAAQGVAKKKAPADSK